MQETIVYTRILQMMSSVDRNRMDFPGFLRINSRGDDSRGYSQLISERVLHRLFLASYPFSFHSAMIFRVALLRFSTIMISLG
jgi:hypothetical protein